MTLKDASNLIKGEARYAILGHLGTAVGALFCYYVISSGIMFLVGDLTAGNTVAGLIISQLFVLAAVSLTGIFKYGLCSVFMDLQYHQPTGIWLISRGLHENPGRSIIVQAFFAAAELIAALPASLIMYTVQTSTWKLYLFSGIIYITGSLIYVLFSMIYSLSWFLMLDYPEITAMQALKKSRELMSGNFRLLLHIYITFIPLYLIGVITFGIGLLWVEAYMLSVKASFYRGLVNGKRNSQNSNH